MKLKIIFIKPLLFSLLFTSTLVDGANHDQFNRAHVMHPANYDRMQSLANSGILDTGTSMQNYYSGAYEVARKDLAKNNVPRDQWGRHDLRNKPTNTMVVGTDQDVSQSLRKYGRPLPLADNQGRMNFVQSGGPFPQFTIRNQNVLEGVHGMKKQ